MKPLFLRAVGVTLPAGRDTASSAVQRGSLSEKDLESTAYEAVSVARGSTPADLAHQAAELALALGGIPAAETGALTFSSIHRHGHPLLWAPAAYLQTRLGLEQALAFSVHHGCNAQFLATTAVSGLLRSGQCSAALVTGGDIFAGSAFDRWGSDYLAYGDAGSAMLLSTREGGARIAGLVSVAAPELEALHRLEAPFREDDPEFSVKTYGVRQAKKAYMARFGGEALVKTTRDAVRKLWSMVQQETGWSAEDVDHVVFPNLGRKVLETSYYPMFDGAGERSPYHFGASVGHLGTADAVVGLAHLAESGHLKKNAKVLLIGAGAGFSWSAMALEILTPLAAAIRPEGEA